MRTSSSSGHGERRIAGSTGREPLKPERFGGGKRPTNLSVRGDLIDAARDVRVNLSALLERALAEELIQLKWRQWREENSRAVSAYNRYVKEKGAFCRIGLRW